MSILKGTIVTRWLRAMSAGLALTASACASLQIKQPQVEAMSSVQTFPGLRSLVPGRPLKVLVVHGMCTHGADWVKEWKARMDRTFGSSGVAGPADTVGKVQTVRYDFDDHGRTIEATFVIWSPWTESLKKSLAYDARPAFPFKRARFNDRAKIELINDCFPDPLIYAASLTPKSVGAGLRRDMVAVVCGFLGGQWRAAECSGVDPAADRAFIAESLGSKLLFDAVKELGEAKGPTTALVEAALARTRAIYMLANQLPLLRLAEAQDGDDPSSVGKSELRGFALADRSVPGLAGVSPLHLVAFTDPNDQFSYRLTYAGLGETPGRIALFNVIASNARTYLGLFENPSPAHKGYWENHRVVRLVLEGGRHNLKPVR